MDPLAQPDFLTPLEAALRARVTPRSVTGWCCRVPSLAVRVMGRWRVDPAALDRLLRGRRHRLAHCVKPSPGSDAGYLITLGEYQPHA